MKIGAAALVHAWGRPMSFSRNEVFQVAFIGRRYEARPHEIAALPLDYSVDQELFFVMAAFEDLAGYVPQKFDILEFAGQQYTVQRAHSSGADEDELWRVLVKGGQA